MLSLQVYKRGCQKYHGGRKLVNESSLPGPKVKKKILQIHR